MDTTTSEIIPALALQRDGLKMAEPRVPMWARYGRVPPSDTTWQPVSALRGLDRDAGSGRPAPRNPSVTILK